MNADEGTQSEEELRAENARLREGLTKVQERHAMSDDWRREYPTEASKNWHDGYITALATCSLIAREYLEPYEHQADRERWHAASNASDREWFEKFGTCGHCGNRPEYCQCTPDDPCGCGPHELTTEPMPCGWCNGTGVAIRPRAAVNEPAQP